MTQYCKGFVNGSHTHILTVLLHMSPLTQPKTQAVEISSTTDKQFPVVDSLLPELLQDFIVFTFSLKTLLKF